MFINDNRYHKSHRIEASETLDTSMISAVAKQSLNNPIVIPDAMITIPNSTTLSIY